MQELLTINLDPKSASDEKYYKEIVAKKLGVSSGRIKYIRITRKSIDARHRDVSINISLQVFIDEVPSSSEESDIRYSFVGNKKTVIIVGAGPAGLFAALRLIELGFKPVIYERGKEISERKIDVALISREHKVNPESNYCFGEGGAGTFSDGKLYTRSNKRGNLQRIYQIFHKHGASEEILYEAHPHIGTDKLPDVIKNIRKTILDCGGEIHFNSRIDNIVTEDEKVKAVVLQNGDKVETNSLILATGHSARDVYKMLFNNKISLESKSFAVGVRVEHPQSLIDSIQYHRAERGQYLPPATYNLVEQVNGRGVFSFCMCPGGFIVPSATEENQVVVNGMSPSRRNSKFANSGIVVEVKPEDMSDYRQYGELCGLEFAEKLENIAWQNGGRTQTAPAQRLADFVKGRMSANLPDVSYIPGVLSSPVHHWLPAFISKTLQDGFKKFDQRMKGFLTNEAVVLAVESRTSSPVRIPRDKEKLSHISIKGLFPCGEGSGYAGGITSSAMDGEKVAEKVAEFLMC